MHWGQIFFNLGNFSSLYSLIFHAGNETEYNKHKSLRLTEHILCTDHRGRLSYLSLLFFGTRSQNDWLKTNPITIKPETVSHSRPVLDSLILLLSTWCPFPIKSPALSAHVYPWTIHFWVSDQSPVWPWKGPPFLQQGHLGSPLTCTDITKWRVFLYTDFQFIRYLKIYQSFQRLSYELLFNTYSYLPGARH